MFQRKTAYNKRHKRDLGCTINPPQLDVICIRFYFAYGMLLECWMNAYSVCCGSFDINLYVVTNIVTNNGCGVCAVVNP